LSAVSDSLFNIFLAALMSGGRLVHTRLKNASCHGDRGTRNMVIYLVRDILKWNPGRVWTYNPMFFGLLVGLPSDLHPSRIHCKLYETTKTAAAHTARSAGHFRPTLHTCTVGLQQLNSEGHRARTPSGPTTVPFRNAWDVWNSEHAAAGQGLHVKMHVQRIAARRWAIS